jgi:hypothetical protein
MLSHPYMAELFFIYFSVKILRKSMLLSTNHGSSFGIEYATRFLAQA